MTTLKVISDKDARRALVEFATRKRALERAAAPTTPCIHDIMHNTCVICMGQDPYTPVTNRTTGETEMQPVNEIVTTKHSGRGYENRTRDAVYPDGFAWHLQRQQRTWV